MSSIKNIRGPVTFRYMRKGERKIYLFGDMHLKSAFDCPNSKSIVEVLNQIDSIDKKYDLYVEGDVKHVDEEIELSNYLREVLSLVRSTDIINVKYTDVRHAYLNFVFDATVYFDTLGAFSELLNSGNYTKEQFNDYLLQFIGYDDEAGLFISFDSSKAKIDQLLNNIVYPLTVMGLDSRLRDLNNTNPELYAKLINFLEEGRERIVTPNFIRNYNNIAKILKDNFTILKETGNYSQTFLETIKRNGNGFYTISAAIAQVSGLYMDVYLLYQLMTNEDVVNNVIYAGEWHCKNYYLFLKSCGYDLVYAVGSQDQCIPLGDEQLPLFSD